MKKERRAKALLFKFTCFFEAPAYHIYAKIVKPFHKFFIGYSLYS